VPKLWIPPESLQKRYYSRASDVWAFGITLWEIATNGRLPYDVWACGDEELVRRVVLGEIMPRPDGCPAQLYDVMRRCWIHKASERPKFAALEGELRAIEL
jgi:serine/threonine protein kinase